MSHRIHFLTKKQNSVTLRKPLKTKHPHASLDKVENRTPRPEGAAPKYDSHSHSSLYAPDNTQAVKKTPSRVRRDETLKPPSFVEQREPHQAKQ